jgi:hypothetical protein
MRLETGSALGMLIVMGCLGGRPSVQLDGSNPITEACSSKCVRVWASLCLLRMCEPPV